MCNEELLVKQEDFSYEIVIKILAFFNPCMTSHIVVWVCLYNVLISSAPVSLYAGDLTG